MNKPPAPGHRDPTFQETWDTLAAPYRDAYWRFIDWLMDRMKVLMIWLTK